MIGLQRSKHLIFLRRRLLVQASIDWVILLTNRWLKELGIGNSKKKQPTLNLALHVHTHTHVTLSVWPVWGIYLTLGTFLKPLAIINFPKYPTFLGNFCIGVKIYHFPSEIILGNFYRHLAICFWSHCTPYRVHRPRYTLLLPLGCVTTNCQFS